MDPSKTPDRDGPNTTMITKRIAPDGVPLRSLKHRLRTGKARGESKAARRLRRRAR